MSAEPLPPELSGYSNFTLVSVGSVFTVWRAREDSVGREVDIKVFSPGAPTQAIDHAIRMAKRLSAFSIDGLERIYSIDGDATVPYLVTETMPEMTLATLVHDKGVLPERHILRIASRIASVLKKITKQEPIVLRSLKPQNIHIDDSGDVKITDFSLAILANDIVDGITFDNGNIVGTPPFISPEQAACSPDIDTRSDMYSLGLILYFLATRKTPFEGRDPYQIVELQQKGNLEDPRALNKDLSDGFATLVSRLTMKKPEDRYANWDDLREDLERLEDGRSLATPLPAGARSTIALTVSDHPGDKAPASSEPAPAFSKEKAPVTSSEPAPASSKEKAPVTSSEPAPAFSKEKAPVTSSQPAPDAATEKAPVTSKATSPKKIVTGKSKTASGADASVKRKKLAQAAANINPYGDGESAKTPVKGNRFWGIQLLLWVLLLAWLLWLANSRSGNTILHLPEALAPEIDFPALDGLFGFDEKSSSDQIAPEAVPASSSQDSPQAFSEDDFASEPSFQAPEEPDVPAVPAWETALVDALRAGDLESAKAAATDADDPAAGEIAEFISSLPGLDDLFVSMVMKQKGKKVPIVYMGKTRSVTPIEREGNAIKTYFKGADNAEAVISIPLDKLTMKEKMRWAHKAATPEEHAAVTIAAMKNKYLALAKFHAPHAGVLAPYLQQALQ